MLICKSSDQIPVKAAFSVEGKMLEAGVLRLKCVLRGEATFEGQLFCLLRYLNEIFRVH